jgi:hypothetical protein
LFHALKSDRPLRMGICVMLGKALGAGDEGVGSKGTVLSLFEEKCKFVGKGTVLLLFEAKTGGG